MLSKAQASQGWSLVELVITLAIIVILTGIGFRISYHLPTFRAYQFEHHMSLALEKALLANLYANALTQVSLQDRTLVFALEDGTQWQVAIPDGIHISQGQFPMVLGVASGQIQLDAQAFRYQIEPQAYAMHTIPQ